MITSLRSITVFVLSTATLSLLSSSGRAQSIIDIDTRHPRYAVELEPHLALGWLLPPGDAWGAGIGGGLRASILIAEDGLITGVNESVALGVGLDLLHHGSGGAVAGECAEYVGSGNERICVRVAGAGGPSSYLYVPFAFQWNFFLTESWSIFGEPGIGTYLQFRDLDGTVGAGVFPLFQIGGRYHFSERATLTLRAGYPYLSVGVSFLL